MKNVTITDGPIITKIEDYTYEGKMMPDMCNIYVDYGCSKPLHVACARSFAEQHAARLVDVAKTILDSIDPGEAA